MRGGVTWRGIGDALFVVWGCLLALGGLYLLAFGDVRDAVLPLSLGIVVAAVYLLRRRSPDVDDAKRDTPSGPTRRRIVAASGCALLAAVGFGFVSQKLGLGDRGDTTVLPPMPFPPRGAVEYRGQTSDGMGMVLWRRPGSVFIRVDSAERERCGIGRNFAQHLIETPQRPRFADRWTFETVASFSRPGLGGLLSGGEETLPKRVDAETYGRFLPGGRAEGRFTRRDRISDDGRTVLDCTRSVDWSARAVGQVRDGRARSSRARV